MLSYQTLDRIADAHNPVLGAIWIGLALFPLIGRRWRLAAARAGLGLACLSVAYALMWLDNAERLWARIGLDYSTHTAVAVALLITLAFVSRRAGMLGGALFCLYVPLMLHQGYHTVGDIASTAAVAGAPAVVTGYLARRMVRGAPLPTADDKFER